MRWFSGLLLSDEKKNQEADGSHEKTAQPN
jgi:hypothetical protein